VGELLIEGPILAKGYLYNLEKTSASFITNPNWTDNWDVGGDHGTAPRRFYKTGDIARYADDGTVICLGRQDAQVKLNGNRIEIIDVETNLRNILGKRVDDLAVEVIVPSKNNPGIVAIIGRVHIDVVLLEASQ
jgi:acyl-CoA synthetase (AMP-forming)/AMP-acid ligase II